MERKLKNYQLHLTVKGPVFIGDGNEIQKKEYVFLNKNTIGVVDGAKFYSLAQKLHLQRDFEKFTEIIGVIKHLIYQKTDLSSR